MHKRLLFVVAGLAVPSIAMAEDARLNVPLLAEGGFGSTACAVTGRIVETTSQADGTIMVRSGPGESPFREIGKLRDGDTVSVCERIGPWLGVAYGSDPKACQTVSLLPTQREYNGPCQVGWVQEQHVRLEKEMLGNQQTTQPAPAAQE